MRAFCASWDRWATDARCAVMLIAHPPKTPGGAGAGQVDRDYAGSTDWHGAARWTLDPADTGEATTDRKSSKSRPVEALALQLVKSSYGPDGYCTASGFLDSGLTVFASTPPRPARGGRVAPGPGFGSRTSPASIARCTSA